MIIGIDVGRNTVKAVSPKKKIIFKSKVGEWRERKLTDGGNYEVQLNDNKYFVADLAEESYFSREMATESKIHDETKILFLAAVGLLAKPNETVQIVTGLPVYQHTPEVKKELKELLEGEHKIKVQNKKAGNYTIEEIIIAPEGGGAYWDALLNSEGKLTNEFLTEKFVRVVDIGSRTINYCAIPQRKYLDRDSSTLNYGVLELTNAAEQPDPVACEQFTRRIVADLSKRWLGYRPATDIILLAGGGSILLKEWLRQHFTLAQFLEDPVFSNAEGFYKMGVAKWAATEK